MMRSRVANDLIVVTRRPRVLRWYSRCSETILLSHGHGTVDFAGIQWLRGPRRSSELGPCIVIDIANEHSKICRHHTGLIMWSDSTFARVRQTGLPSSLLEALFDSNTRLWGESVQNVRLEIESLVGLDILPLAQWPKPLS
jgi:hypothetical protein